MADQADITNPSDDDQPVTLHSNDVAGAELIFDAAHDAATDKDARNTFALASVIASRLVELRGEVAVVARLLGNGTIDAAAAVRCLRDTLDFTARAQEANDAEPDNDHP